MRIFFSAAILCCFGNIWATPFAQLGSSYQDTHSYYSAGDSASATGRYFATQLTLGYEGKTWEAAASVPYAVRNSSAEYQYASPPQTVSSSTSDSGMSDPSLWASVDAFAGNRYAPAIAVFGALSAPLGKNTLGLMSWHARPGLNLEYYVDSLRLAGRVFGELPFAPKNEVAGQYHAYAGAGFNVSHPVWKSLAIGADSSFATGDFVRTDASLRVGGFLTYSELFQNMSIYLGSQVEVYRSDRDVFVMLMLRYNFAGWLPDSVPPLGL